MAKQSPREIIDLSWTLSKFAHTSIGFGFGFGVLVFPSEVLLP